MPRLALYRKNGNPSKEEISIISGIDGVSIIEENTSDRIVLIDIHNDSINAIMLSLPEWGIESNMSYHPSWSGYK